MTRYQPFYCEENVWWMLDEPRLQQSDYVGVLLITNEARRCLFAHQRAAPSHRLMFWDYHAVIWELSEGGAKIWDLDTRLGMPFGAGAYLEATFPELGPELARFAPRFRLVDGAEYRKQLWTDRSHMRAEGGVYARPPPAWEPPQPVGGIPLSRWLDLDAEEVPGEILSLAALGRRSGLDGE